MPCVSQKCEDTFYLTDSNFYDCRCSLMGFDLNRHWLEPSPWAHPTLYATKNNLMELDRSDVIIY